MGDTVDARVYGGGIRNSTAHMKQVISVQAKNQNLLTKEMSVKSIGMCRPNFDVKNSVDGNSGCTSKDLLGGVGKEKFPIRNNRVGDSTLNFGRKEDPGFATKNLYTGNSKIVRKHRKFVTEAS